MGPGRRAGASSRTSTRSAPAPGPPLRRPLVSEPARAPASTFARRLVAALALIVVAATVADARSWSWLGVRIRDLSEQEMDEIAARHGLREGYGVAIVEVLEGTPAASAGLQNGDIVVAFGDRPVTETRMLQRLIAAAPVGREARLTVLRAEGRRQVTVQLAAMPPPVAGERVAAEFGFVLRDASAAVSGLPTAGAPAIAAVVRGSPAEKAGLETGDVILKVAERMVATRDAAREALAEMSLQRPLQLTVSRGDRRLSLTLPPP